MFDGEVCIDTTKCCCLVDGNLIERCITNRLVSCEGYVTFNSEIFDLDITINFKFISEVKDTTFFTDAHLIDNQEVTILLFGNHSETSPITIGINVS